MVEHLTVAGKYTLTKKLGSGAFGIVYLGMITLFIMQALTKKQGGKQQ